MRKIRVIFEFVVPDDECPIEYAERAIYSIFESGESIADYADIEEEDISN